jgi:hypothetical protein
MAWNDNIRTLQGDPAPIVGSFASFIGILNIRLERGGIPPTLFLMAVIMATVTTLIATPAFHFIRRGKQEAAPAP